MTGLFSGKMITPRLLPLLWVVGSLLLVRFAFLYVAAGDITVPAAILFVLLGILVLGVICETVLVIFRMLATLSGIDAYFHNYEKIIDKKFQMLDERIQELKESK